MTKNRKNLLYKPNSNKLKYIYCIECGSEENTEEFIEKKNFKKLIKKSTCSIKEIYKGNNCSEFICNDKAYEFCDLLTW